jgi:hypothetical protein
MAKNPHENYLRSPISPSSECDISRLHKPFSPQTCRTTNGLLQGQPKPTYGKKGFPQGKAIARLRSAHILISLSTSFDYEVPFVSILRAARCCDRAGAVLAQERMSLPFNDVALRSRILRFLRRCSCSDNNSCIVMLSHAGNQHLPAIGDIRDVTARTQFDRKEEVKACGYRTVWGYPRDRKYGSLARPSTPLDVSVV